jgi:RimJ/RimL family protein N-acetyltransferase
MTAARTIERLETARLIYERLRAEHGEELAPLLLDPRVTRTLWPGSGPMDQARLTESLRQKEEHWDRFGFGLWLLRDRESGEMIGRGGLQHTFVGGRAEVEVGWAIVPERWGQGLATELALASLDVAFDELRFADVIAFALPDNGASIRVMEKTGFGYERDIVHAGLPHVLYRCRREAG